MITYFYVDTIARIGPAKLAVRLENLHARSGDPDRYRWLTAVDADGAIELITAGKSGSLWDPDTLEEVRSAVADFIATEDQISDKVASNKRQKALKQFEADKARQANLLKRAERQAELQASEKLRVEKMASDLGCTVALAKHIDSLERRLRVLDLAMG